MSDHAPTNKIELVDAPPSENFDQFIQGSSADILLVPEAYGESGEIALKADAGDFGKWVRTKHPDLKVSLPSAERLVLRSGDIWLPLIFLATNVTLPVFVNLLSGYIEDRLRGRLKNDQPRVRLSVQYLDANTGKARLLRYDGDAESFKDMLQNVDLDKFDDT